jgi:hypothetical protein
MEATIGLSVKFEGQAARFAMLHSADTLSKHDAASYWLERIFYTATSLKTLSLTVYQNPGQRLTADRVVPMLTEFFLWDTIISSEDLLAMIASSKDSLISICLRQVVLVGGLIWSGISSLIAKCYRKLDTFRSEAIRELEKGSPAVDFLDVKTRDPEDRIGLKSVEKGQGLSERITSLIHDGKNAGTVLDILSSCVKAEKSGGYRMVSTGTTAW